MNVFLQMPNWVDEMGVIVMSIVLIGLMLLAAEIWLWIILEIGIAIYERLYSRVMRLNV